jgi:Rap1a immunity proteins
MPREARLKALLIVMVSAGVVRPSLAELQYQPVGAFETASDLAGACFTEAPFSEKHACWGYILGVADIELAAHNICIPDHKEYDVPKLTDMVTGHLRASSGPFDLAAASVVGDFFERSFPCHTPAKGPVDAYWSLAHLRRECVREGPNSEKVVCNAYIVGAVDALQDLNAQAICIPPKTDTDELVDGVITYTDKPLLSFFIEHSSDPPDAPAAQSLVKFAKNYFSCATNR